MAALAAAITLEALAFDTWPAVAFAAGVALLDVPTRRSPFALLTRVIATDGLQARPGRAGALAAVVRAVSLAAATLLLALDVILPGIVLGVIVALEGLVDAITGRCGACLLARRRPPLTASG